MNDKTNTISKEDLERIIEMTASTGICEATDGCRVEPDGYCQHGCPSWLIH